MNRLRNSVVYLLSSLFFVALLSTVAATNIVTIAKPAKIESLLSRSGLYSSFIDTAVKQAKSSTGDTAGSGGFSLSDAAVQQAAQTAFSTALLQKNVNNFIDVNYAWLQGKTAKPSFVVDLSSAKQAFAQQIGQYVTAHLASLPVCTYAQSLAYKTLDPLAATCRPASISATAEGAKVAAQLSASNDFLGTPVITADTFGTQASGNGQPYYEKFAYAPKIYQWAIKAPYILAGAALVSALGIIFTSPKRQRGLRKVGVTLAFIGILLIITKFIGSTVLDKVQSKLFNNSSVGDMQQSLTNFLHLLMSEITRVNLYFGIAFVLIAGLIFLGIFASDDKSGRIKALKDRLSAWDDRPVVETTSQGLTADINATSKPLKKPRLIQ